MSKSSRELATEIIFGTQNEDTEYMTGACGNLCQKNGRPSYNDIHQDSEYDSAVNGVNGRNNKPSLDEVRALVGNKLNILLDTTGSEKKAADVAYIRNAIYTEAVSRLVEDTEYMKSTGSQFQNEPGADKFEGDTGEYDPSVNGADSDYIDPDLEEIKNLAGNSGANILTSNEGRKNLARKLVEAAEYMKTSGTTNQDEPADDKPEGSTEEYDPAVNGATGNSIKIGLDAIKDFVDAKALNLMTGDQGSATVK